MRDIVAAIRQIEAELRADVLIICQEEEAEKRDALAKHVEGFLSRIRKNEGIKTFVHRRDEPDAMKMLIGVDDHEAKDAIVKALWKRAERDAGSAGIRIWTKELKSAAAMRSAAELQKVARLIGVHESFKHN